MKLAYLSRSTLPSRTANSIHVMQMCNAFARCGHDVTLFARPHPHDRAKTVDLHYAYDTCDDFRIHPIRLGRSPGAKSRYGRAVGAAAFELGAELAYGRCLHSCIATVRLGLETVFEAHAIPRSASARRRLARLLDDPKLVRVVVITHALENDFRRAFPNCGDRILVAHDAANDASGVTPAKLEDRGRLHVGYVGQLYAGKGMEIIERLAPECPWADFHIVGGEETEIAHWQSKLRATDNVTLHGHVPHAETAGLRAAMDVLIAPYLPIVINCNGNPDTERNLSPLKLFEYMASERPIVTSDFSSFREFLRHDDSALLCDPSRLSEWKEALERLRDDAPLRRVLAARARGDFLAKYTWEARAHTVIAPRDETAVRHDMN